MSITIRMSLYGLLRVLQSRKKSSLISVTDTNGKAIRVSNWRARRVFTFEWRNVAFETALLDNRFSRIPKHACNIASSRRSALSVTV